MPEPKQTQDNGQTLEQFTARSLPIFSPFRITKWEAVEKTVTIKQGERKGESFTSTSYILTLHPQSNPQAVCNVTVFDRDFQLLKSLAFLNDGFNKCYIQATRNDAVKGNSANSIIYTAFKG